ncbi:MAG: hypothetical protein IJR77_02140 [Bacteroidales bacterium]|nr:hypothetical protein [Bacteroidales bacterium]
MKELMGIQARVAWEILFGKTGVLEEPEVKYGDSERLDLLSARELFDLLQKVQEKLQEKGYDVSIDKADGPISPEPQTLHISKDYRILIDCLGLKEITLRPLLRAVFILFLRHPEGIRIKEKQAYREELLDIYAHIFPNLDPDICRERIDRLIAPGQNAFSENLSHLNRALTSILGPDASPYQVYGSNGRPRRILLDPVYVVWE